MNDKISASDGAGEKLVRPQIFKAKPVGDICLEIAQFARECDRRMLEYLMKVAAEEAYDAIEEAISIPAQPKKMGLWDWDVSSDKNYADPVLARLFGVDPKQAVKGLKNEVYVAAIHPDDRSRVLTEIGKVVVNGGCFEMRYRVVANDTLRWIYARGSCFITSGKIPSRFPGAVFDITDEVNHGVQAS